jgi:hypothetical protein
VPRHSVLSVTSPQQFIDKLLHFKNVIKQIVPSALVGFVTIPSANLFELHCSTQSHCVQQAELNNKQYYLIIIKICFMTEEKNRSNQLKYQQWFELCNEY